MPPDQTRPAACGFSFCWGWGWAAWWGLRRAASASNRLKSRYVTHKWNACGFFITTIYRNDEQNLTPLIDEGDGKTSLLERPPNEKHGAHSIAFAQQI